MTVAIHDPRQCELGEGPLWHPLRRELFWFDILSGRLLSGSGEWQFDEPASAAGWTGQDTLIVASASALWHLDLASGAKERLIDLEADNSNTRSNDGRADPWGGFWIGTMGRGAEPEQGAIYRYLDGGLTRLYSAITIPNAICFSPDRRFAYYTDSPTGQVMRQPLDRDGWPDGTASVFIHLASEEGAPDGAVTDAEGCLWLAQWGAGAVTRYDPDGNKLASVDLPAAQVTCPAFGGAELRSLFLTSAHEGMKDIAPEDGLTFCTEVDITGRPEPQVRL